MAASHITRALPDFMTILAWYKCDHVAPVFEYDILSTKVQIEEIVPAGSISMAKLHVEVFATRGPEAPEAGEDIKVLDWRLAGLLA